MISFQYTFSNNFHYIRSVPRFPVISEFLAKLAVHLIGQRIQPLLNSTTPIKEQQNALIKCISY